MRTANLLETQDFMIRSPLAAGHCSEGCGVADIGGVSNDPI
jgi:hypothetical protein